MCHVGDEPDQLDGPRFGVELRRYRMAAGLSLRNLAELITFDFSYLAQVEGGVRDGSVGLARKCDTALGAHGHLVRMFIEHKAQRAGRSRQQRSTHPEDRDYAGDSAATP